MDIIIRDGIQNDLAGVLALIKELAEYEKAPEEVKVTLGDLKRDGAGDSPLFRYLVAEHQNSIVGIALYYFGYSTWKGKMLYLDDLIVTEAHRKKGIGEKLFRTLIKIGNRENAKQMRWHVLDWNTPAIEFYKKYNVDFDDTWVTCKLNEESLIA